MRLQIIVVLAALALSCGDSSTRVRDRTCAGCLDAEGFCLLGNEPSACGLSGVSCVACANAFTCERGECVAPAGGTGGGGGTSLDGGVDDCSAEAKLIYVVDQNRRFSSFNPRLVGTTGGPFADLGTLSCPAQTGAEPFSMAVDRNATAWVVYDSGELFTVDVKTLPLQCVKTAFRPQQGVAMFGMGFVANTPGSSDETLFISGSDFNSSLASTKFGTLSTTPPYTISLRGTLPGGPELTGTGDAKLWAFSPNVSPPKVARLSKVSGTVEAMFEAPALAGSPRAWAFAFWGGDFWIFTGTGGPSDVNRFRPTDGTTTTPTTHPSTIVGAGVSTCAPQL